MSHEADLLQGHARHAHPEGRLPRALHGYGIIQRTGRCPRLFSTSSLVRSTRALPHRAEGLRTSSGHERDRPAGQFYSLTRAGQRQLRWRRRAGIAGAGDANCGRPLRGRLTEGVAHVIRRVARPLPAGGHHRHREELRLHVEWRRRRTSARGCRRRRRASPRGEVSATPAAWPTGPTRCAEEALWKLSGRTYATACARF